jgi:hypothetical protein
MVLNWKPYEVRAKRTVNVHQSGKLVSLHGSELSMNTVHNMLKKPRFAS